MGPRPQSGGVSPSQGPAQASLSVTAGKSKYSQKQGLDLLALSLQLS